MVDQLYKVHFRRHPSETNMGVVARVTNATDWLIQHNRYHHFVNWYDNRDAVVFVLTNRDTALKLKLSLQ